MSNAQRKESASLAPTRRFSLDNRVLVPVLNSDGGLVNDRTRFHFWQDGDALYADYFGGDVREGHIIGRMTGPRTGQMLYHCMTTSRELKAGRAVASFTVSDDGLVGMILDWRWISGGSENGVSHYTEIRDPDWRR